ncbi:MAG: hypothetical protein ACPGOV_02950 [Magnetovibrionaceae bacterium]
MRNLLAFGLPVLMIAPFAIWAMIQSFVLAGESNSAHLILDNWVSLGLLALAVVVVGTFITTMIRKSGGR